MNSEGEGEGNWFKQNWKMTVGAIAILGNIVTSILGSASAENDSKSFTQDGMTAAIGIAAYLQDQIKDLQEQLAAALGEP